MAGYQVDFALLCPHQFAKDHATFLASMATAEHHANDSVSRRARWTVNEVMSFDIVDSGVVRLPRLAQHAPAKDCAIGAADATVANGVVP